MGQPKETPEIQPVHEFKRIRNTKKMRIQSFLRGAGSIVVLMPDTPPMITRTKVGSFSETSRRVAQFWNRSIQMTME